VTEKYFICSNCSKKVYFKAPGTKNRNHCPYCLVSLHIDSDIGDRSNPCRDLMFAIGKTLKEDGEEVIVHKCQKCGYIRKNRVAGDDSFEKVEQLQVIPQD
jgi:ribosome biogenesis GTPase / thiamine phosphate phosphatase